MLEFLSCARRRLYTTADGLEVPGPPVADPASAAVAERLRDWRRRLARASGVPPHVLLHDSTVQAIAARRPATAEELLAVPGLGPVKVARYGPAILEVVAAA
jgi:superfamily II DNA helicase RecQ